MAAIAVAHARAQRETYLGQLLTLLSIPSISTAAAHAGDVRRAADWLAADMERLGLEHVAVMETAGHPVVYGDWLHAGAGVHTVLLYGHYDVQPPDPVALWHSPPFAPQIRDGRVYARGASDNKAQLFSHLKALESMRAALGRLPVNVKVLLDGEEEVGSPHLDPFVSSHQALLAADSVVVSDGAMLDTAQPTIDYALRGVLTAEVLVTGPARDLHSGSYGGSVHNPVQALAEILAALHDADGRVRLPGFYDRVRPLDDAERVHLAGLPYAETRWRQETGAPRPWGEPDYSLLERMTARPTLEINGIWGGYQGEGDKTIIPAQAGAKLSLRLVADQDADEVADLLVAAIHDLAPDTVRVTVTVGAGCNAAVTPFDSPEVEAAMRAFAAGWGATPVRNRAGGSLPIIATLQRVLGVPYVLMPFGLDDNRHAPNEHYRVDHFNRGIETAIHYYHNLAAGQGA